MTHDPLSLIAAWELFLGLVVLFVASLIHWKKAESNLLLVAAIGFAISALGNAYLSYLVFFPGALSSASQTIQGAFEYANTRMAYASFVTALGLAIAAVSYLFFTLRTKSN